MADSEPRGFREYVAARRQGLLATAYVLTGSQHGAEDLVQATLVKVWPRWNRVAEAGDPDAYVRKALVNNIQSGRRLAPAATRRARRRFRLRLGLRHGS